MLSVGNISTYAYDIVLANGESSIVKYLNVSDQTEVLQTAVTSSLLLCGQPNVRDMDRANAI